MTLLLLAAVLLLGIAAMYRAERKQPQRVRWDIHEWAVHKADPPIGNPKPYIPMKDGVREYCPERGECKGASTFLFVGTTWCCHCRGWVG